MLAAAEAQEEGITVNVVGVIDYGTIGELGSREIEDIARAGGGISQIVGTRQLAHTMQMMTRKTVVQTIQQAVNRELTQILGEKEPKTVTDLEPAQRARVVEVMDDMAETTALQVILLIDVSASMKPKLAAVEEGIRDLMLSLQARIGQSKLSVFHFPGRHSGEDAVMDIDWTTIELQAVFGPLFGRLQMKGATPTGPAIQKVIDFYRYGTLEKQQEIEGNYRIEREGMLGDNVV